MSEREAFEKSIVEKCGFNPKTSFELSDVTGDYKSDVIYFAWIMWQASVNREGYKLVPVDDLTHIRALNEDAIESDEKYLKEITSTLGRIVNEMIEGSNE